MIISIVSSKSKYFRTVLISISIGLTFIGCAQPKESRYAISDDLLPKNLISVKHIENAIPRYEPRSLGGNDDYTLFDKEYRIISNPKGFSEEGLASWYGEKFHGYLTSNGEIYDMYSMMAAHNTLPLPSYVKVTNLDNEKSVILRVNDRGPFHEDRIIDLSYAAAYKLGTLDAGTGNVKVDVITTEKPKENHLSVNSTNYIIQIISSTNKKNIQRLATKLSSQFSIDSFTQPYKDYFRLILGPINDYYLAQEILEKVQANGYPSAFIQEE